MNQPGPTPTPDGDEPTRPGTAVEPADAAAPVPPEASAPATVESATGYTDRGVPTFEHVRDKIEGRFATSLGSTELAQETDAGRSIAEQEAERAKAAQKKLDEIRRSLGH